MYINENELTIRNANADDAKILCEWWNDGKIMDHAGYPNGLGIDEASIVKQLASHTDDTYRRLIIEYKDHPIGEMSYRNMGNQTAQIGIKICEPIQRGKGLGTRLLDMFINNLFEDLEYSKIILDTGLDNLRAQHVYEKLGFKKVKVNVNKITDQVGNLRSSVDYELVMPRKSGHNK